MLAKSDNFDSMTPDDQWADLLESNVANWPDTNQLIAQMYAEHPGLREAVFGIEEQKKIPASNRSLK